LGRVLKITKMENITLMPFQDFPFNADTFVCEEFLKLKEEFSLTTAVETGSCLFSTTKWLGENFEKVFTVEVNEEYAKHGRHKIAEMKNVVSKINDSIIFLKDVLYFDIKPQERCIFFLDAHWGDMCPLLGELDAIKYIGTEQLPVIVIHDFKVPNEPNLGFDDIKGQAFDFDWIKSKLDAIYGEGMYKYYYNSDATSTQIKRGVIYITPKK